MSSAKNIEKFIKNLDLDIDINAETERLILRELIEAHEKSKKMNSALVEQNIWRTIMKSKITRLAAAAVIIVAVIISMKYFGGSIDGATPAWAIDQTIKALEGTHNCVISGTNNDYLRSMPFECQIKFDDCLRYKTDAEVYVIKADIWHLYEPAYGEVIVRKDRNAEWYDKLMEVKLWGSGSVLKQLRKIADSWHEVYEKDMHTNRDSVFVTCTAMNRSIWFQFDVETKLVVRGKLWRNLGMQGKPAFVTESIHYNVDMPEETFDFEVPAGVKVVSEEEHRTRKELFGKAWGLDKKKQYVQAIELYRQIYEKFPTWEYAPWSLERIADLYRLRMDQLDKSVELYEKIIVEYPQLSYRLLRTYHSLGKCYMKLDQNDKALEAFETCLELGRERNREWFVFDECEKRIAELKQKANEQQ